ncbi:hypothetical protein GQ600_17671 [Phytophthora cactorum]|nr:hypothetical protein GQ600_17671 [Phytophthora cactorum]
MYTERAVLVVTLVFALVVLLRKSFQLANEFNRISRRSSSITEPFMPPRLKSDSGLYELLDRHKNIGKAERCQALDAFRGLTLSLMVVPLVCMVLGFSVFLSSDSTQSTSKLEAIGRIGQRTVKLFVLGLFINNGDSWSEWRIPGVLQALSAAYLIVAAADWFLPLHGRNVASKYRVLSGIWFSSPTCQKRYQTGPYDPKALELANGGSYGVLWILASCSYHGNPGAVPDINKWSADSSITSPLSFWNRFTAAKYCDWRTLDFFLVTRGFR